MRFPLSCIVLVVTLVSSAEAQLMFGTPSLLTAPINDGSFNWKPTISANNLTLYWASTRSGGGSLDIWTVSRSAVTEPWGEAMNVSAVNSADSESEPSISADGLELYFARGSSDFNRNSYDIWVSERSTPSEPWGEPEKLSSPVNGSTEEADPSISADGLELYFDSNRDGPFNIYVSRRETRDEPFGTPEVVVSSTGYANISSDGLMLFSSQTADLALSTRASTDEAFAAPVLLGDSNINTGASEFDGVLASDGSTLYFTRASTDFLTSEIWQAHVVPEPSGIIPAVLGVLTGVGILRRPRGRG